MSDEEDKRFPALTPAQLGGEPIPTVNGRELHTFLEVGKDFSTWMKDRIEQYGFTENVDFVVFPETGDNPRGGRPAKGYAISLDMAKELSMVERNERGKEARRYFIECERQAKQARVIDPIVALSDPETMRGLLLTYSEKVIVLQPKADAFDLIASTDGSFAPTDAAKTLGIRPREFISWLRMNRWTYRRLGSTDDVAYEDKLKQGLMVHKSTTVPRLDGSEKVVTRARITPKGLAKLALIFKPMKDAA